MSERQHYGALGILAAILALTFVGEQGFAVWQFLFLERRLGGDTRGFWELTYFITNSALVIVAIIALSIAWRQSREAERTRLALIYIEINKKYGEPDVTLSRQRLAAMRFNHRNEQSTETLGTYIDNELKRQYNEITKAAAAGQISEYSKTLRFLTYLEDIAVLVRRGLISQDIIFDFMGGTITFAEDCVKEHVIWRRKQSGDRSLYANTLWLMERARQSTSAFEYNEGDYRF